MAPKSLLILIVLTGATISCFSQETASTIYTVTGFPGKFFNRVSEKSSRLESLLDRQMEKYLQRLLKKERKLKKQLQHRDSAAAAELFGDIENKYASPVGAASRTARTSIRIFITTRNRYRSIPQLPEKLKTE
jgi:hypothetical protein